MPSRVPPLVLVTGGARGITARCVIGFASRTPARFILLGRTDPAGQEIAGVEQVHEEPALKKLVIESFKTQGKKPTPATVQKEVVAILARREIHHTLSAIQEAGGEAVYIPVDVTDLPALREKLDEAVRRLGPIQGIIHGAGNLADKRIENKSLADFHKVYKPKVQGLNNLLACFPPEQLDFLVLFSSVVSLAGNAGQADYALSNRTLDQIGRRVQAANPNCRVLTINWGPWDGGMVTPELRAVFESHHVTLIPSNEGVQTFIHLLETAKPGLNQVMVGDLPPKPAVNPANTQETVQVRRKLRLESNPFLIDHVIGSNPVLPATCAGAWLANTAEQIFPGYTFFKLEGFRVLKGIVFDENLAGEHVLEFRRTAITDNEVVLDGRISSGTRTGKTFLHYSGRVTVIREPASLQNVPVPPWNPAQAENGKDLYKDGTLFHGSTFQGIQDVQYASQDEIYLKILLPTVQEQDQGQFPVQATNPFLNDSIVQCLLVWSQRVHQAPCLPSFLETYIQYRPIHFNDLLTTSLRVKKHSPTSVIGDIQVWDSDGKLCMQIIGLEGTVSQTLKRHIGVNA